MLTVAMPWSSYGGVVIHYVLQVLWMMSCFTQWALWWIICIPEPTAETTVSVPTRFCSSCVGLNREDAMDRSRWRKQIGVFDDHDECEWVNVSSGTGSPGLSRTKSKES